MRPFSIVLLLATARGAWASSGFTDVTQSAGLDFLHSNGAAGEFRLQEIMGGGGGFLDVDGDGDLDVFLAQSHGGAGSRLFRNDDGRFADVTGPAGVAGYAMGCAACDWDRDGDVDLYVTRVGSNTGLRNDGDGTFSKVALGFEATGFSSSAAFLDYDADGWPDLYVVRYVDLPPVEPRCTTAAGQRDYCNPTAYGATIDRLYRNIDGERFVDVTGPAGIDAARGYGLALLCADLDDDGAVDVYVANDQSPAFLWRNRGDGTFAEDALFAGCAYNDEGAAIAGMGTAGNDLDGDGDLDLVVTNIRQAPNLFLRNDGGQFVDSGFAWGNGSWMHPYTGFGIAVFDRDHDGDWEMFVANGSVVAVPGAGATGFEEPNQFLAQDAAGRFVEAGADAGAALGPPGVSRGVARGDYDSDGDVDLLVLRNAGAAQLLRNDGERTGHWLLVDPREGRASALHARVTVTVGGRDRVAESLPHASYLSTSDPRVHFGLGETARYERIRVRWADGTIEEWGEGEADRIVRLDRGSGRGR